MSYYFPKRSSEIRADAGSAEQERSEGAFLQYPLPCQRRFRKLFRAFSLPFFFLLLADLFMWIVL